MKLVSKMLAGLLFGSLVLAQGAMAERLSVSMDTVNSYGGNRYSGTVYYNGKFKQITVIDRDRAYNDCNNVAYSAYWGRRGMNFSGYGTVDALNSERTILVYNIDYALDCRLK
jgi:hypothetical protein